MFRGFLRNKCPWVRITVVGREEGAVEAIVDTGFNGYLTLPEEIAKRIGLTFTGSINSGTIADGSTSASSVYIGKVICDNSRTDILVDVQPNCKILLGTALLEELGLSLFVDIVANRVELNPSSRVNRP